MSVVLMPRNSSAMPIIQQIWDWHEIPQVDRINQEMLETLFFESPDAVMLIFTNESMKASGMLIGLNDPSASLLNIYFLVGSDKARKHLLQSVKGDYSFILMSCNLGTGSFQPQDFQPIKILHGVEVPVFPPDDPKNQQLGKPVHMTRDGTAVFLLPSLQLEGQHCSPVCMMVLGQPDNIGNSVWHYFYRVRRDPEGFGPKYLNEIAAMHNTTGAFTL